MANFAHTILSILESMAGICRVRGHSFWLNSLSEESVIIDLGGNKGDFSRYFYQNFGCKIFCVEANPKLAEKIDFPIVVDNIAMTREEGIFDFVTSNNPEAGSLYKKIADNWGTGESIRVPGKTLETYIKEKGISHISLLKMDIEGAELELLDSMTRESLSRVDQLTIEFHDFIDSSQVPRVQSTISKLEKFGFLYLGCNSPQHDDTLFIKRELLIQPKYWLAYFKLLFMKRLYLIRALVHKVLRKIYHQKRLSYEP